MQESIIKFDNIDEQKQRVTAKWTPPTFPVPTVVEPLVQVEWGQGYPFWNKLSAPQCPNGYYVAGCVATAAAQIMSYWEYPAILDNMNYSWMLLNKHRHSDDFYLSSTNNLLQKLEKSISRTMVADLFQQIGASVNMSYGCEVSLAYTSNASAFLVSKGFTLGSPYYLMDYSLSFIKTALEAQRPLLANGCNSDGCHAWVIDGFWHFGVTLIHNNWGWDGFDNGYYLSTVFDVVSAPYQNVTVGLVYR